MLEEKEPPSEVRITQKCLHERMTTYDLPEGFDSGGLPRPSLDRPDCDQRAHHQARLVHLGGRRILVAYGFLVSAADTHRARSSARASHRHVGADYGRGPPTDCQRSSGDVSVRQQPCSAKARPLLGK